MSSPGDIGFRIFVASFLASIIRPLWKKATERYPIIATIWWVFLLVALAWACYMSLTQHV